MKYESLQKMTVITGLLVFSLGICSYAEDKVKSLSAERKSFRSKIGKRIR